MKDVTGLFAVVLLFLAATGGGTPLSVECTSTQCAAVVQEGERFKTAQDKCASNGGHLMTVRSSSHALLQLLLKDETEPFWIGLRRTTACPDPEGELKGYQWVTEDPLSEYSNWLPTFDSSCTSPRCVSVSRENDFKWTQEPCGEQKLGFLCEYRMDELCLALDNAGSGRIHYWTRVGNMSEESLILPGTVATLEPSETKYLCFGKQWIPAPWSCEVEEGGCEHKCAVDDGNVPFCYCPQGQSINPKNGLTCEVPVKDDPCLELRCQQACHSNDGSPVCVCDVGFHLAPDGRSCLDEDECADKRRCPGEGLTCLNSVGSYKCVCRPGFLRSGDQCADEDECASAPCEHKCTNTYGGYECSCYDGYQVDPKFPNRCQLYCGEVECPAECDPNDPFQCYCADGYISEERGDSTVCIDIDECEFDLYCDHMCENTYGGYVCSCKRGYKMVDEYKCEETDEEIVPTTEAVVPPEPEPTRQPSGVSKGVFIAIIFCTTILTVLLVFLGHHALCNRRKETQSVGALKAQAGEDHGLQPLASDA